MKRHTFRPIAYLMLGVSAMILPACNGIFSGIYDVNPDNEEDEEGIYGFVEVNSADNSGTIYIDATSLTDWVYIDLHSQSVQTVAIGDEEEAGFQWDFAVHRYDAKTNGGAVLETSYTGLDDLRRAGIPSGNYVEDIWTTETITTDMSHMMDGYLEYAESYYNPELSKWLDVDTSTMPPIYTMSGVAYVLRMEDGTCAGVKLTNFMDKVGVKGYMTIAYIYPLE